MAKKTYTDWPDKAKHTISYAQHKKNVAKPATKQPIAQRIAGGDRALLKRALRDPGLRSQLPEQYLKPEQKLARRLNAPVTPGSSLTNRDIAREANAATTVEYGPQQTELDRQLRVAQQGEQTTGTFYDQYLAQLAANQRNVADIQQATAGQLAGVGAGITGLAAADLTGIQNQANQGAAARGTTAGDLTGLASQATATRQALMGSFQAQQALQGASAQQYAGGLANVVGPQQKQAALNIAGARTRDVGKNLSDLAAERGAFNVKYRGERRGEEAKNVLAQQALLGNLGIDPTTGKPITKPLSPGEQKTQAEVDFFNKYHYWPPTGPPTKPTTGYGKGLPGLNTYGFSYDEWTKMSEKDKATARKRGGAGGATTGYGPGLPGMNALHYTYDEWNKLTPRQQADARAGKGAGQKSGDALKKYASDFFTKYNVQPVTTPAALTSAQNAIKGAYSYVARLKAAGNDRQTINSILLNKQGVPQLDEKGQQVTKRQGGKDVKQYDYYPQQQQTWLQVANDLIWGNGKISLGTAAMLHKLGYSTNILGLEVPGQSKGGLVLKPWTHTLNKVK